MDRRAGRALIIDGGGARGYMPNEWLKLFNTLAGIDGSRLWDVFDVIAGTSVGGMSALAYANGTSPDDLTSFYTERGGKLFTIRSLSELGGCDTVNIGNRPSLSQKVSLFLLGDPFYKSPCAPDAGNSNYGSNILHEAMVELFGDTRLDELKTNVIVPAYKANQKQFVMYSNYQNQFLTGYNELAVNVGRATSAAPVYLPSYEFGGNTYKDGGLYNNSPSTQAYALLKWLKPRAEKYHVLSLGTGLGEYGFEGTIDTSLDGSINELMSLFDIAITGGQESNDLALKMEAAAPLSRLNYYRFQVSLADLENTELDNTDPDFLNYLLGVANTHFTTNITEITDFKTKLML